jgi:photosystem II stability/assembly factor-like uncharacterized protein
MKHAAVITCVLATLGCSRAPAWEALPLGTAADFRSVWFTDANHGWIGGGSYEISGGLVGRTEDGGRTWRFTSGLTARDRMSVLALHFFDNDRGLAATDNGRILSTADGGGNWTPVERRSHVNSISSLAFLDARHGWAAGHGDVVRTDDGGETWSPVTAESGDRSYESPVRAMQFHDERDGWIAGMHASLLRTRDGGATWEPVATPLASGDRPHFWDLFFVDRDTGWIVGEEGTILATTDGSTWIPQNTGLKDARSAPKLERIPRAGGVDVIDAGDRTPGFTIAAVRFVDRRNGWIAGFYAGLGRSLILRTEDAGTTWAVDADIDGEELRTLFVQGREHLWAIGARVREGPQAIYRRAVATK